MLTLLADGLTNREIASDLPQRGDGYLNHVYDKLGVGSRTAAVATARATDRID